MTLPTNFEDMDHTAFLNIRNWLEQALITHGAKRTGGGIGFGQADIDITLDGMPYNVSIKPLEV